MAIPYVKRATIISYFMPVVLFFVLTSQRKLSQPDIQPKQSTLP